MSSITQIAQSNNKIFSSEALDEAKKYNGRRVLLRKLVDSGSVSSEILEAHTQLMLDDRKMMKGILCEAKLGEKIVYLIGTCHARLIEKAQDLPNTEEGASKLLCEIIHPVAMDILQSSNLYVEFNMKDPMNAFQIQSLVIEHNLIHEKPLPRQERTKMIEDTAMKSCGCGLDIALMEQQYKNAKVVYSLETAEAQIESLKAYFNFQKIDPTHFLFSSEHTLESIDAVQWGNLDSITELEKEMTEEMKLAYAKRNKKITVQVLEKLSSGEKALFAVGATHLAGGESILSLLKDKGVQIKQINF